MRIISLFLLSTLIATPALARKHESKDSKKDPNEVICRTSNETGSRLAKKRVCMTRSEWKQYREDLRHTVQRVQDFKPAQGS